MTAASLLNALLFVIVGLVVFLAAFTFVVRFLPGDLWNEALKNRNVAAAIIVAGIALAIGWIIAAAVH